LGLDKTVATDPENIADEYLKPFVHIIIKFETADFFAKLFRVVNLCRLNI
jgi:hypothetical protein